MGWTAWMATMKMRPIGRSRRETGTATALTIPTSPGIRETAESAFHPLETLLDYCQQEKLRRFFQKQYFSDQPIQQF